MPAGASSHSSKLASACVQERAKMSQAETMLFVTSLRATFTELEVSILSSDQGAEMRILAHSLFLAFSITRPAVTGNRAIVICGVQPIP